jgi:hypothetical protein
MSLCFSGTNRVLMDGYSDPNSEIVDVVVQKKAWNKNRLYYAS